MRATRSPAISSGTPQALEQYYRDHCHNNAAELRYLESRHSPNVNQNDYRSPNYPTTNPVAHGAAISVTASSLLGRKHKLLVIYTDLLIPGRGDPIQHAAAAIEDGYFTYVGPQRDLPEAFANADSCHVPYLLPGFWDCHAHYCGIEKVTFQDMIVTHPATLGANIARSFHDTLMCGVTSVREVGGFGMECYRSVEQGFILGPTVYGAGAAIGQTNGSCDAYELPIDFVMTRQGVSEQKPFTGSSMLAIADGVDECIRAVRLQVRRGAKCIKVVASGGVMSLRDNPQNRQFSDEELAVIIGEARRTNLAVAAHAHGKAGILAAVKAGAHTIEHGSFLDEECADLMKERGTIYVPTRTVGAVAMQHLDILNPQQRAKMLVAVAASKQAIKWAIKKGVKFATGTDLACSDPNDVMAHGGNAAELVYLAELGMTPLQAIEAATANSADTLGPQAPKAGQIKVGYVADVIGTQQDPLKNIKLFLDPENVTHVFQKGILLKSPEGRVGFPTL